MRHYRKFNSYPPVQRQRGFTLIEILVALAVMVVMLSIILVPINMGLNVFHIGKARSEVQAANSAMIDQITSELRTAVYVYPNEAMPGITNKTPYNRTAMTSPFSTYANPYLQQTAANASACSAGSGGVVPVANTSRIDFIPAKRDDDGVLMTPVRPADYIVTYYARRLNLTRSYDPFTNPIVMFRAQMAARYADGTDFFASGGNLNLNLKSNRYPNAPSDYSSGGACDAGNRPNTDSGSRWLVQSAAREPIYVENVATEDAVNASGTIAGSHTLITPRDMALVAPNAGSATPSFQPDSSFVCDDANNDGKIDRVTMSLLTQKYDSLADAEDKSQQIRSTQSVALPNIK